MPLISDNTRKELNGVFTGSGNVRMSNVRNLSNDSKVVLSKLLSDLHWTDTGPVFVLTSPKNKVLKIRS